MLACLRGQKIIYLPSYADFRSRANVVMLLDFGHRLSREHIQEEYGYTRNTKLESVRCLHCRGSNTITIKQPRSIWEGDQEVVKTSCIDASIQFVINLCIEAMLGISLYSYP
jgi:hypothetical protein